MAKAHKNAISPTRAEDYPEWYQQVIRAADMAESSPVRGCMVIRPWGYGIWENIQRLLDARFKATGHQNAYFPLFIPKSFFEKEAEHVEGFAKECAVVTHHRLSADGEGGLKPDGELEEPLIVRPTSETIIGAMFAKWVQSYRDLPLLINQWANVVRWELRPRLFLRTTEFLWQEGHTAHATADEAREETMKILELYATFAEQCLAIPVVKGEKTESERFPGAVSTYSIEAMMGDMKALQAGTSHFLGQNFAKASQIKFRDAGGAEQYAWTSSWGVSTRLIGGVIMAHGDDDGVAIPPCVAPVQVVVLPLLHKDETRNKVLAYCEKVVAELREHRFADRPIEVLLDTRDMRGGEKMWSWIKKGVPMWLELGEREADADTVFVGRRDRGPGGRVAVPRAQFVAGASGELADIQAKMLEKAREHMTRNTRKIDSRDEFYEYFTPKNAEKPELHGGFALCHWSGEREVEEKVKAELGVTIRCIPLDSPEESGNCIISGKPSKRRVVWAKAY
jgi:prolyl-tRNA synthetase